MGQETDWSKLWNLDPAVTFLNHGSFGACPRAVLSVQQDWRDRLERQPLQFFAVDWEPAIDHARNELAAFVGADPEELVFVPNATTGVNTVLRSLCVQRELLPGDELLTTNQEYNACRNALDFVAELSGARIVVAEIPFPITDPQQVIEAVSQAITPQTRLALLDHVVSQTGLVLPIAPLVRLLSERGVETLIDGAHAPGMVPLNLQELGATYYTGNCHKWLSAPKGAGFLMVRRDRQALIRPLTISHGANSPRHDRSRFWLEFDWTGTHDPSPYLCVPTAIQYLGSLLPGGWPELMDHNRVKALAARKILSEGLQIPLPAPEEMVGAMAVLPLPDGSAEGLYKHLIQELAIEVPIIPWPAAPQRLLRVSAQLYNTLDQYQYLTEALLELLPKEEEAMSSVSVKGA